MKLDPELIQYLTKEHMRVLTAVEMGMRNHEFVPHQLIESLSGLKRSNAYKLLNFLLKHKCVMHTGQGNGGYALTNMGYDYLVLKVFIKRGIVNKVGLKIGMGKESDIYVCSTDDPERPTVIIKFARLGRTSFRTVKNNRDYLKKNQGAHSWLYLSRLASLKEFAFMKALYDRGFPTPIPIDCNPHGICMSLVEAYPMTQISVIPHPRMVYERLMSLIVRLAENGLVHGDFNEFNLMINDNEDVTMIDFPQMVSTTHLNAKYYFERDVKCVQNYFSKHYGMVFEGMPSLDTDVERTVDLDKEVKASGFLKEQLGKDIKSVDKVFDQVAATFLDALPGEQRDEEEEDEEEEQSDGGGVEYKDEDEGGEDNQADAEEDEEEAAEVDQEEKKGVESDQAENDGSSEDEIQPNNNRKVRFAETFVQREELKRQEENENAEQKPEAVHKKDQKEKQTEKQPEKPKKVKVNEDYVKDVVKKQLKRKLHNQQQKRNINKDKGKLKDKETIKNYFEGH